MSQFTIFPSTAGSVSDVSLLSMFKARPRLSRVLSFSEKSKITVSSDEVSERSVNLPYPPNAFPGGRRIQTVYGPIQIFEWGPTDGAKVLLIHGLGTPCIALHNMAHAFVARGCRVMLFDLFGRGYTPSPAHLAHSAALYTTQIHLVLASSPLQWVSTASFHILGFSLGGSIAASFAAYHPHLLRSVTLVCPGGLIRTKHVSTVHRFVCSRSPLIPEVLRLWLMRRSLRPRNGRPSADVPGLEDGTDIAFDDVLLGRGATTVGNVIGWQLGANEGFVGAYLSTIREDLVYRRDTTMWKVLAEEMAKRRMVERPAGLPRGKVCLVIAKKDVIVAADELLEDLVEFWGPEDVDVHVLNGGHEVGIVKGEEIVDIAMASWDQV